MSVIDLRVYKKELRKKAKEFRRGLSPEHKAKKDRKITSRVLALPEYKNAKTLITYVSTDIEVDTMFLIERALRQGKTVAVPRCVEGTRRMKFYAIKSPANDLGPGTYGLLEPIADRVPEITDFSDSVCIVPALLCDRFGYRLGYGGGYYDRFLSGYGGTKICAIYSENVKRHLKHGKYDIPVDFIVTDRFVSPAANRSEPQKADSTA